MGQKTLQTYFQTELSLKYEHVFKILEHVLVMSGKR